MPRTKSVTNEQWLARVRAWQASGQRAEAFCQPPRNWDPAQLRWWRWKLEQRGLLPPRRAPQEASKGRTATAPTFLRLVARDDAPRTPASPPETAARCELVLRNGRTLRFDATTPPQRVRDLADTLEGAS